MVKYIIAKQLVGKKIITLDGYDIGRLIDVEISEVTGKITSLIAEPDMESKVADKLKSDSGQIKIPYNAVFAVNNYVMVDRKNL